MTLPVSPNAISMLQIRNEFYNATVSNTSYGTTDSNLYNLNWYRGKPHYNAGGSFAYFPTGAISYSNFHGVSVIDPSPPPPPPPSPPGP